MFPQSLSANGIKQFIILACLMAVQFAHGAQVKTVWVKSDETALDLHLDSPVDNLKECSVTTNRGEEITVFSNNSPDLISENISYNSRYVFPYVRIVPVTLDLSGKWRVKRTFHEYGKIKEDIQDFDVRIRDIYEYIPSVPGNWLQVFVGNYIIFKVPGLFPTMESCTFEINSKWKYDVLSEENSDIRIKEPGVCGVRILVNETLSEKWELYVDVRSNETYYTRLEIESKKNYYSELGTETLNLRLGREGSIIFRVGFNIMTFCQLEDPSGKKLPLQYDDCSYKIPFVTKSHEGLWKVHYGLRQSSTPFEAQILVVTYDCPSVNSLVTYEENEHMNLTCHFQSAGDGECLFTRPDNLTIGISPEDEAGRYEHFRERDNRDMDHSGYGNFSCKLTIRSPSQEDFGAWKCSVNKYGGTFGTVLRTENFSEKFRTRSVKPLDSNVHAPAGDTFISQRCLAESALDSCCMLTVDGTEYTLTKTTDITSDLTYIHDGVVAEVAADNSEMMTDSSQVKSTVTNVQNEHINLMCQVRTVGDDACVFTRSDNLTIGIVPGVGDGRYEYYGEGYRQDLDQDGYGIFECGLTIRSPTEADFGDWKCSVFRYNDRKEFGAVLRTQDLLRMFNDHSGNARSSDVPVRVTDSNLKAEGNTVTIPSGKPMRPDNEEVYRGIDKHYMLELTSSFCGLTMPESNTKIDFDIRKCGAGTPGSGSES